MGVTASELKEARDYLQGSVEIVDVSAFMVHQDFNPGHLSLATYIRLFADKIEALAPYDRLVYADADVLFNRSISELACTELKAPLLAARSGLLCSQVSQDAFDAARRALFQRWRARL